MARHSTTSGQRRALLFEESIRALREEALGTVSHTYAPYSGIRVGAAILGTDGSIATGCNIENATQSATLCAERVAFAALVARGVRSFEMLVVATDGDTPAAICGVCRQTLGELAPDLMIISCTSGGNEVRWRLSALLPHPVATKPPRAP